ncbi:MAG TPA: hypothetical protein VFF73_26805 [Planctomycetota bacterium]|nr:hypothetical protein [Planctomycetota bacterium]
MYYAWATTTLVLIFVGLVVVLDGMKGRGVDPEARLALGATISVWAVLLWVLVHLNRRVWHVELHEYGVVLKLGTRGTTQMGARWTQMLWFDDSHPHLVRLQVRDDRQIVMATHEERQRLRVLELLVAKGIPRREA